MQIYTTWGPAAQLVKYFKRIAYLSDVLISPFLKWNESKENYLEGLGFYILTPQCNVMHITMKDLQF